MVFAGKRLDLLGPARLGTEDHCPYPIGTRRASRFNGMHVLCAKMYSIFIFSINNFWRLPAF